MAIVEVQLVSTEIERNKRYVYIRRTLYRVFSNNIFEDPFRVLCAPHVADPNGPLPTLDPYRVEFRWGVGTGFFADYTMFLESTSARLENPLPDDDANRLIWLVECEYKDYRSADSEGVKKNEGQIKKLQNPTTDPQDVNSQVFQEDPVITPTSTLVEEESHLTINAGDNPVTVPAPDFGPSTNSADQPHPPVKLQRGDSGFVLVFHTTSTQFADRWKWNNMINSDQFWGYPERTIRIVKWESQPVFTNKVPFIRNEVEFFIRNDAVGHDVPVGDYGNVQLATPGAPDPQDRYEVIAAPTHDDLTSPITTVLLDGAGGFAADQTDPNPENKRYYRAVPFAHLRDTYGLPAQLPGQGEVPQTPLPPPTPGGDTPIE